MSKVKLRWAGFALIILVAVWAALLSYHATRLKPQGTQPEPNILAAVTREPANGLEGMAMGPAYLRAIERTAQQLMTDSVTELSGSDQSPKIQTVANYAASGPHKVVVVQGTIDGRQRISMIFGYVGQELVTVVCAIDFADEVPLSSGPCNRSIREAFGGGLIFY